MFAVSGKFRSRFRPGAKADIRWWMSEATSEAL